MNIFPSRLPETSGEEKVEQNREGQNEEVHDKPVKETPKFEFPRTLCP